MSKACYSYPVDAAMRPRQLLDSLSIADSRPPWSYLHTGTLPQLISSICHSYENTWGVGGFFPFWNVPTYGSKPSRSAAAEVSTRSGHSTCLPPIPFLFKILRTVLRDFAFSCTRQKLNSFVSKRFRTLYPKTWGNLTLPCELNASQLSQPDYLLMSSFASNRFSSGSRKGFVVSGAPLMACVISLAAAGKSPAFDEIRASARWLIQ
jgi:hypothetical protein